MYLIHDSTVVQELLFPTFRSVVKEHFHPLRLIRSDDMQVDQGTSVDLEIALHTPKIWYVASHKHFPVSS